MFPAMFLAKLALRTDHSWRISTTMHEVNRRQLMSERVGEGDENAADRPPRRGVLKVLFGSLVGLGFAILGLTVALWTLLAGRFLFPNALAEPPERFRVGQPREYPPGHVETRFKERYGVWIVHGMYRGKAQIYALRTVCTHLGCITLWMPDERRFKCPCHGSGFFADGVNFEGPAPRPLERYALHVTDDGQLEVDRSKVFHEELGQWSDPASYVSV